MRIIHGGMARTRYTIPFHEFRVDPPSAIVKTVLLGSIIFHIFTRMENQPLKEGLKQKRRIILTKVRHIFSFA